MSRLTAIGLAICVFPASGCVSEAWMTEGRMQAGVPVKTPDPMKVDPAYLETSKRVETLGKRIIEQNVFSGLTPLFHTLGVPEPVLFHRGPDELFISEGLVNRCKTETQLAAVLCLEMGRMRAEKRSAKEIGVDLESVRDIAEPNPLGEGEIASLEPVAATGTKPEKPKPRGAKEAVNATELSRELLRGAGFDPVELTKLAEVLKGVQQGDALGRQMAGPAAAPKWQQ